MKKNQRLIQSALFICASVISTASLAGTVTIPNAFSSGTAAVAAEVNANFSAVKDAVDDNATTIDAIETAVDDNAETIEVIEEDSFFYLSRIMDLEADIRNNIKSGHVSISAHAFRDENAAKDCRWLTDVSGSQGFYLTGGDVHCDPVAGIQIPHKVVVNNFTCVAFDNTANGSIDNITLTRTDLASGAVEHIFITPGTTDEGGFNQLLVHTLADFPVENQTINNALYAYSVRVYYSNRTDIVGSDVSLFGCTVAYAAGS